MAESRASSEPLTSPSPSPPPDRLSKKTSFAKGSGLDSSSELSELTEDEQDGSRDSTHSNTPQASRRIGRKKRGGIVPMPMWGWAEAASRKAEGEDTPTEGVNGHLLDGVTIGDKSDNVEDDDDEEEEEDSELSKSKETVDLPGSDEIEEGGDARAERESDEEEVSEEEDGGDTTALLSTLKKKNEAHEGSTELTEVEDVEDAEDSPSPSDGPEGESEGDSELESEEDEPEPADDEEVANDADPEGDDGNAANMDIAPVVPLAPAGSSIMAGQQLIKTPTPSPSTSPEPEEKPKDPEVPDGGVEAGVDAEPEADVDNEDDAAEQAEQPDPDIEADVEAEVEAEVEEAELDMQPAHRAEALDVLATIELKYALLREQLYVEKMEDLAREEAMVLQGIHPEMVHLLNELQVRHDRRLELAAKKRRYDDEHVALMRKVEDNGVWCWWKYERDELQTEMFAETNRKRRRLECEKRNMDRPQPTHRIPQPSATRVQPRALSARDLIKFASPDVLDYRSHGKHKETEGQRYAYPALSVLSPQEIQADLQIFTGPRNRSYYGGLNENGPGIGVPPPHEHYVDYGVPQGMGVPAPPPPSHMAFGHGPPLGPPQPNMHHPYAPPPSAPGRPYHHPPSSAPMNSMHHVTQPTRPMQGPGQPHIQTGPGVLPTMSGYLSHNTRPIRRTPSPPLHGYEQHGGLANGGPPYGGTTGPGQHWAPVQSNTGSSAGAGPSKQPIINGWGKDHRGKEGRIFDGRERSAKQERELMREKDKAAMWHDTGIKEVQDEHGRTQHPPPLQQTQHPHRHTSMHQTLQGVPHHHHVVHHHHNTHHHHPPSRQSSGNSSQLGLLRPHEMDRHVPSHELDTIQRHPRPTIEHINLVSKPLSSSPAWKVEDTEPSRERGRAALLAPAPLGGNQYGPPPSDRPQVTPFAMSSSQPIQVFPSRGNASPSRRESWIDETPHGRPQYEPPSTHGPGVPGGQPIEGISRHNIGHPSHPRPLASPSRQGPQHNTGSPRPRNVPGSPPHIPALSNHHSPSRVPPLGSSSHMSPRMHAATTPKGPRALSPLPAKFITSINYPPSGPGTPGLGSRLGTPGLAGPGTRPDGPINGHGTTTLYATPALAGPGQPLIPPLSEATHIVPPKVSVVQLGNGS